MRLCLYVYNIWVLTNKDVCMVFKLTWPVDRASEFTCEHSSADLMWTVMVWLQAVCCSDKLHCCPSGSTCDLEAGTCNKDSHSVLWNTVSVNKQLSAREVDCPGKQQTCPDDNTCCKLSSGSYGCCPLPKVWRCSVFMVFADCLHARINFK